MGIKISDSMRKSLMANHDNFKYTVKQYLQMVESTKKDGETSFSYEMLSYLVSEHRDWLVMDIYNQSQTIEICKERNGETKIFKLGFLEPIGPEDTPAEYGFHLLFHHKPVRNTLRFGEMSR